MDAVTAGNVGKSVAVEEMPVIEELVEEEIPIVLEPIIEVRPVEIRTETKEIIIKEMEPVDYSKIVSYAQEQGIIVPPDDLLERAKKAAIKILKKYKIPPEQLPIYTKTDPGAVPAYGKEELQVLSNKGWTAPMFEQRMIGVSSVQPIRITPHGTFYSLATQSIANIAATQSIAFELDDDVHELTHDLLVDNDRIYAVYGGSYEIIFSGIANIAIVPGAKHLEIWLEKNGTDVTDSNTRVHIPNDNVETTVAVSYITDLNPGEYFRVMTWGDDTDCQWLATAAAVGPVRPAVPSVIMTVKRVSEYP
jgi:DNA-directed RNA polymerase subunit H (RpoH/RPB5)